MQTRDLTSLTNSLFQVCAREAQKNGFTIFGTQAKEMRQQCEFMAMMIVKSPRSEGHSEKRAAFRSGRKKDDA